MATVPGHNASVAAAAADYSCLDAVVVPITEKTVNTGNL